MSVPHWSRLGRSLFPAILIVYVIVAALYAVYTPAWQAPDEPAHYNYVRYLAEQHRFPVLKPGDYPAAYLDEIKAAGFPGNMPVAPIRYEFHQPPLYYLIATPVYWLFRGALLPLRLLSVAIGVLILAIVYAIGREVAPRREELALGATAFVAFLPMHVAVTAAVTNDPLAELLLAAVLLLAIRYVKRPAVESGERAEGQMAVILGIATGLALTCKSGIYIAVPLVLAAIAARHFALGSGPAAGAAVKAAGAYGLAAVALAAPWWLRNVALYGGLDILGLGRHDQVVAGQLRTVDYLAAHGAPVWLREFAVVSLQSFWGQFGWMGVLLDERLYLLLAIVSALAVAGLAAWGVRAWRGRASHPPERRHKGAAGLLALAALLVVASYAWYNTQFVQFQGRYLFPASAALGLAAAVGWREVLRRDRAWIMAGLLVAGAVLLGAAGLLRRDLPGWPLFLLLCAAAALLIRGLLSRRWDAPIQALPYLFLVPLDLACLFLFIVPQLAP